MTYDEARHEVVLFGAAFTDPNGGGKATTLNDTWTFSGRKWTEMHPTRSPGPLADTAMVFFAARQSVVLVGVPVASSAGGPETWEWNGSTWSPLVRPPFALNEQIKGMAFDHATGSAVLVTWVGATDRGPFTTTHTWTFSGLQWTLRNPPSSGVGYKPLPTGTSAPRLVYAPRQGVVLAVMGDAIGSQTWEWNGFGWFLAMEDTKPPYDPLSATMAFDPSNGEALLLQEDGGGRLWRWSGSAWTDAGAAPEVDSLYGGTALLSDTGNGHVIVLGDKGRPNRFDVLWEFVGGGWVSNVLTVG
jgi:hypothetical protein